MGRTQGVENSVRAAKINSPEISRPNLLLDLNVDKVWAYYGENVNVSRYDKVSLRGSSCLCAAPLCVQPVFFDTASTRSDICHLR